MNLITGELDERIQLFEQCKQSAYNKRERKHADWIDNYTMYRDKVIVNRLEQRQAVNLPLIRTSVKTILKDVDDAPNLYFHNLDNDTQKEVFYNEYWTYSASMKQNKLKIKDFIDKKQVVIFGRSFKKQQIKDGKHFWEVKDPQKILVDRYVDPSNIDSARFIIETGIFVPLSSLSLNPNYDQAAVKRLQKYYQEQAAMVSVATGSADTLRDEQEREANLDVVDAMNPVLGETYVEINECFMKVYNKEKDVDEIRYLVIADGIEVLVDQPQEEIIGVTEDHYWRDHYIYSSWADDPDATDFWSDSIVDALRNLNKVVNAWFSQMVENRTLKNYNMNFYDATKVSDGSFVPQTFEPVPWGWYPLPGNPNDVLKAVPVQDLSESLEQLQFIINQAEKVSAATSANQGQVEQNNVTLGEVQLALSNAKERVKSMSLFFSADWEDFGNKYIKLLEAASDKLDDIEVVKKGRTGKRMWKRIISTDDWKSKSGYSVEVKDVSQSSNEDMQAVQVLQAARSVMPTNKPLDELYKRRLLELSKVLSADEVKEVMDFEKNTMNQPPMPMLPDGSMPNQPMNGMQASPAMQPQV